MQKYYIEKNSILKTLHEVIPQPDDNEVLVKISNISICGSDIHLMNGTYNGPVNYPIMFGHEWAGVVEKTGKNVSCFIKGDKVTGDCSRYCSNCEYCSLDKNLCTSIEKYGITIDGVSSEYILRDQMYLYKLPDSMPLKLGALVEPLSVGMNIIKKLISQKGDISGKKILVFGLGGIGLGIFILLKNLFNADYIYVSDLSEKKLKLAENLGGIRYSKTNNTEERSDYSSLYLKTEFDIIFETTGSAVIFSKSLEMLKPLGTLACLGMIQEVDIIQKLIVLKSLTILGSIGGTGSFKDVITFIKSHSEICEKLISKTFNMDEPGIRSALEAAHTDENLVKVQLEIK